MNSRLLRTVLAFVALRLAVVSEPVSAQSQNPQALTWFSLGLKEADAMKKVVAYKKAIELDPLFVEAIYNLGLAY